MNTRIILAACAALLLAGCSGAGFLNTIAPAPSAGAEVSRNVAYGALPRQRMDVYAPKTEGPHPVLVFFHGGSWDSGSKGEYAFVGRRFASLGFLTAVVNYRLSPEGAYPVFMEDAAAATAWIQKEAAQYGGNPDRLFLAGHSAGGYIAVQLAVAGELMAGAGSSADVIDGVAGIAGPYDFLPSDSPAVDAAFGEDADPQVTMPAYRAVAGAPPMLFLVGGDDTVVYPHNAKNMAAALDAVGTASKTITYPGASHADTVIAIAFGRKYKVAEDIADFFQSLP